MNSITERIKSRLDKDKGLTQAGLARFCKVSSAAVSHWMKGEGIDYRNLLKIAMVISDNPKYAPETYTGEECNRIFVYGRVLEINRSL